MSKAKKKRGRPALPPEEGKRYPLNMRTTKALRNRLQKAASTSGRSLAHETELRLERSFAREDDLSGLFGGKATYHLMVMLGTIINLVQEQTGKKWAEDPRTYAEVMDAVSVFMEVFRPADAKGLRGAFVTSIGRELVELIIDHLQEAAAEQRSRSKPKG